MESIRKRHLEEAKDAAWEALLDTALKVVKVAFDRLSEIAIHEINYWANKHIEQTDSSKRALIDAKQNEPDAQSDSLSHANT